MTVVTDTFTDTAGINQTMHATDSGHTWAGHPSYVGTNVISDANRARAGNTSPHCYYIDDFTPASADYDVSIDHHVISTSDTSDRGIGPAGRIDGTNNEMVYIRYEDAADQWLLCERIAGTENIRDTAATPSHTTPGVTKTVKLELRGTTAKGYVDGVEILTATLTTVTAAGFAGIRGRQSSASNSAGHHYDNFAATDEIGVGQDFDLTPATETDTALALSVGAALSLSAAPETDTAQALTFSIPQHYTITAATETSSPAAILANAAIAPAATTDVAQALTATKTIHVTVDPASTTAEPQSLAFTKTILKTLAATTQTDSARALSVTQAGSHTIPAATSLDEAQTLSITKTILKALQPAGETSAAVSLSAAATYTISPATLTDTTVAVTATKAAAVLPALTTHTARPLGITHVIYRTLVPAATLEAAVALEGSLDELDPIAAGTLGQPTTGSLARPEVGRL